MSLDFNCSGIKDWQTTCRDEDGNWSSRTSLIVFRAMFIGIPVIDQNTCWEFYTRSKMWDRMLGQGQALTLDDVKAYIGLRTNVTKMTTAKFRKHLFEVAEREMV